MGALAEQLRGVVRGPVFGPEDDGFAAEVAGFNLAVRHTPEVAVGITSEAEAAAVVRAAADSGTPVRVLATGHGSARAIEDGVLVTTARMANVTIDGRIAHIEAGCRWAEVVAAAAEHGLAPITGASDAVGCIGYTLGGGLGPLSRTYGVSSDWVRGFRVVTGTGEVVTANADENPDLFWALRGGKGGLGLVTSMDFELVELTSLYGGSLFFGADDIASVLSAWLEWTRSVPETVNSSVAILRLPPLDAIPEPIRGQTTLTVRYAFVGDPAEGERLFQPIRDAGTPVLGGVGEMPARDIALIHNDPKDPLPAWDRAVLLAEAGADFATTFVDVAGPGRQLPLVALELRHLGGAVHRDVPEGSAVGGRGGAYSLVIIGVPDPALFAEVLPAAADGVLAPLAPWISPEMTVNFAGGLSVHGVYEACWPAETLARLTEVRTAYDPDAVFPYGPRS
ncbi:FAD-binding oxidoreductase [Kribbella turkmenica]|uniref:FAD-binding oxidoreductase n=1 Tax=Kribbella turkmenica TaxID=2530375 RepID=A0A4R4X8X0_9ACTN|nr:FAD-binding protein [Kribbella turkmenica]TDD26924.1 FAD-binding oxidoreductase [Kribbella turkmenica]